MSKIINLPPQRLPMSKKTREWRKQHLDWADNRSFFNYDLVRKSVMHKAINYDLVNGKLHMDDLTLILNPAGIDADFIAEKIQHYPIINSKINVLKGEESKRVFDYKVVITNPTAISEIEKQKKADILQRIQEAVANTSQSEEEFNAEMEKMSYYYTYEYQDFREIRANAVLNHYNKEYNIPLLFNEGFMDAMIVAEEIYQCDIVGGEPIIKKLNPLKVRIFKSGYSNKVEDADMIIIEDYWSPGKIIDTYYDVLTEKDRKYIENAPNYSEGNRTDSLDNIDERASFIPSMAGDELTSAEGFFWDSGLNNTVNSSLLPYDLAGNLRVLKVFWKSRRKIKKVKSYDLVTGEEVYTFHTENYVINKDMGEEEEIYYINEAWEGTKIGEEVYVNMRPRPIQYNRISNPSECHFGIIGSIYNVNDSKPFSLVDMMKFYSYYYDIIHDRLNRLIARNWGAMIRLDLSKKPRDWDVDKWMYYAKTMGLYIEDSFNEGNIGASTGKLAGAMNNASNGIIPASDGNQIQQYISLLDFIKNEMSEVAGITRQREGQIFNRETVGGVERATLQSSHITEWLFTTHEDVKKRVLECFLETAKIALKGRSKKFQYILPDGSQHIMDLDGDEFAECDYGLVLDNSQGVQELSQNLNALAQIGFQNQTLSLSAIMKLYNSYSLAEKQRIIEAEEIKAQERQAQMQQQQLQVQQEEIQAKMQESQMKMQQEDLLNQRDNETKLLIAEMNLAKDLENMETGEMSEEAEKKLQEQIREFDARLSLDKEKLELERIKHKENLSVKKNTKTK